MFNFKVSKKAFVSKYLDSLVLQFRFPQGSFKIMTSFPYLKIGSTYAFLAYITYRNVHCICNFLLYQYIWLTPTMFFYLYSLVYYHWRRSTLNSAGAFWGIFTPFYTINFWGGCKSGGACAPAAPPSSAPMYIAILIYHSRVTFVIQWHFVIITVYNVDKSGNFVVFFNQSRQMTRQSDLHLP